MLLMTEAETMIEKDGTYIIISSIELKVFVAVLCACVTYLAALDDGGASLPV